VFEAIERIRRDEAFEFDKNTPRPPMIFALCDYGEENERLLLAFGFKRDEIRTIYTGISKSTVREQGRLWRRRRLFLPFAR
jgi:hypothetical protein